MWSEHPDQDSVLPAKGFPVEHSDIEKTRESGFFDYGKSAI